MNREPLEMWTIYDHPADFPDFFVAKMLLIVPGNLEPVHTNRYLRSISLETLRKYFTSLGMTCLIRDSSDDPVIVETWV